MRIRNEPGYARKMVPLVKPQLLRWSASAVESGRILRPVPQIVIDIVSTSVYPSGIDASCGKIKKRKALARRKR